MRKYRLLFGLLLFALLAGCGQQTGPSGNDGGNNHGIAAQRVATALQAAEVQLYEVVSPLNRAGLPVPPALLPLSVGVAPLDTASWDCTPVTVFGNLADADDDGIPVNATFNGRCTWSYSGPGGAVSGWWEYKDLDVQDPNDHDPTAGIKASGEVDWSYTVQSETVTGTWELTQHDLTKQNDHYNFVYKGTWTLTTKDGKYTLHYDIHGTWTPDDPDNPWGDGVLSAEGSFSGRGPGCANGWNLQVNLTGLHHKGDKIVDGTASFSGTDCDGHSGSVSITWSPTQVCITVSGHTTCVPQ